MEQARLELARQLLATDENHHTQTIRRALKKAVKSAKAENNLTPEYRAQLRASMFTLLEARKRNKSEAMVQRDAQLHMVIRERIKVKKFFAPKLWFKIALPIIVWAILQEIIMASTDIVDNIFVNWMKTDQVKGLADLQNYIHDNWTTKFSVSDITAAGLSADYMDLNYSAGQIAVNGVTASNQLYTIMYCVVSGACYGIGVYSAQYFGAGNTERLKNVTALKLYFSLSVTGLFALIAIPGITEPLIKFTTNPGKNPGNAGTDVMSQYRYIQWWAATLSTTQGVHYFRTIFWSYLLLAINESIITSLRETRRPIYSFIMSLVSLTTNCILNLFLTAPTFLGGFKGLGVEGTALATACSRVLQLAVIISLIAIKRFEFFPSWRSFAIKSRLAFHILLKAAPIIVNELLYAFGQVLIVKLKGMYSVEVLTANAMFSTIVAALFSPLYHGMNAGISVFVGNELGANRFDVAEYNSKHLLKTSVVVGLIFGLLLMGISFVIPDLLFSNANAEAKRNAQWMMFIFGAVYPIYIICNGCYSILRTGGSMWGAFFMDSGMVWSIQIPLLAVFILLNKYNVLHLDFIVIHAITMAFYLAQTAIAFSVYCKKTWLRNVAEGAENKKIKNKKIDRVKATSKKEA